MVVQALINKIACTIRLYPNPAHGSFTLEGDVKNAAVKIYDLLGRSISPQIQRYDEKIMVSTSGLTTGVYYVSVNHGHNTSIHKVVVD